MTWYSIPTLRIISYFQKRLRWKKSCSRRIKFKSFPIFELASVVSSFNMYRYKINRSKAIVYIAIVFLVTIALNLLAPAFPILVGGFLLAIILTTFIPGKNTTYMTAVIAAIIMLVLFFLQKENKSTANAIGLLIFQLALIAFTALATAYLKNLYKNISSDRTHMSSLFENATEGILLTNKDGIIVLSNPAAERTFGYDKDELIGQPVEILIPQKSRGHHPQLRESFLQHPGNRSAYNQPPRGRLTSDH